MSDIERLHVETWFGWGCLIVLVAFGCYGYVAYYGRELLRGARPAQRVKAILFHLPGRRTPPWLHCIFSLLLFVGLSLFVSGGSSLLFGLDYHLTVELTSLVFGVLIALTALYTLWQTFEIEEHQGVIVEGFRAFLERLVADLERVVKSDGQCCAGRRILILTTNAYFGSISFGEHDDLTRRYWDAMSRIGWLVKANKLDLRVACGDAAALNAFHVNYYKNVSKEPDRAMSVAAANALAEKFIEHINDEAGNKHQVFSPLPSVPKVQFIVVGDILLEFLLSADDMYTEVRRCRRSEDMMAASRFVDFFEFITTTRHSANSSDDGNAVRRTG